MRCAAICLVAAALGGGCNYILGLTDTDEAGPEAGIPIDAETGTVFLTYQLEDTNVDGTQAAITFPALPAPIVSTAVGDADPLPASYDPNTGAIAVPITSTGSYRFIYQLDASATPHEVQWNLVSGHLVVPFWGHLDSPAPPASSGYEFKPAGAPGGVVLALVYTTGVWTVGNGDMGNRDLKYPYAGAMGAVAIGGGPEGTPSSAKGDIEIIAEQDDQLGTGFHVTAYSTMSVDLTAGTFATGTNTWNIAGMAGIPIEKSFMLNAPPLDNRIRDALGFTPAISETFGFSGGPVPSLTMPCFTVPGVDGAFDTTMIVTLMNNTSTPSSISYLSPFADDAMADAVVATRTEARTLAGGPTLASGLQTQIQLSGAMVTTSFPAAMPESAMLGTTLLDADGMTITVASTDHFVPLTFSTESGFHDDDFLVTLSSIAGTTLTPVRTFQVLVPSVQIPTAILVPGTVYAVQIVGRLGYPGAPIGDYTMPRAQTPSIFGTATLIPGTFTIQLQ